MNDILYNLWNRATTNDLKKKMMLPWSTYISIFWIYDVIIQASNRHMLILLFLTLLEEGAERYRKGSDDLTTSSCDVSLEEISF